LTPSFTSFRGFRHEKERKSESVSFFRPLVRCTIGQRRNYTCREGSRQAPWATRNFLKPYAKPTTRWRSRGLAAHFYFVRKVWRVYQGHQVYRSKPRTRTSLIVRKKTDLSSLRSLDTIEIVLDTRRILESFSLRSPPFSCDLSICAMSLRESPSSIKLRPSGINSRKSGAKISTKLALRLGARL
jgi:hypothetical protein